MRHQAFRLITCKRWPGDNAKGSEAAQLALLRLLYLQQLIRRAVRARRTEEAALLARSTVDACIVGLYCLHSGTVSAIMKLRSEGRGGKPGAARTWESGRCAIEGGPAALAAGFSASCPWSILLPVASRTWPSLSATVSPDRLELWCLRYGALGLVSRHAAARRCIQLG